MDIRNKLHSVRSLRFGARLSRERAADELLRASRGMSRREARNLGGTGWCPLTEHALRYGRERDAGAELSRRADALWADAAPLVRLLSDEPSRRVVALYYGSAMSREEVSDRMRISEAEVAKMLREAVKRLTSWEVGEC